MATYKVAFKLATKQVKILPNTASTPADYVSWGTFNHDDDANDGLHFHGNHAVYHHVRGLAYRNKWENMQALSISYDGTSIEPPK